MDSELESTCLQLGSPHLRLGKCFTVSEQMLTYLKTVEPEPKCVGSGPSWVSWGFTGFHGAFQDFMGLYRISWALGFHGAA